MHHMRRVVRQQRDGVLDGVPVRGGFRVRFPHEGNITDPTARDAVGGFE